MAGFPSSFSPQNHIQNNEDNNHTHHTLEPLAEDSSPQQTPGAPSASGSHTPSHGGIVNSGHEYDMFINTTNKTPPPPPPSSFNSSTPPVSTATTSTSRPNAHNLSNRQRPVSMPAQQLQAQMLNHPPPPPEVPKETERPESNGKEASQPGRNTTRNRVLGEYTLSKTLGAGSMGKVKLAHHNVTGEKVSLTLQPKTLNTHNYPVRS